VTEPAGRFLFVPCLGGDAILQYEFDGRAGRLTPNRVASVVTKANAGPRHLVFHPTGRFAYCTNELDATVGAYRVDAGAGTLTALGVQSLLPPGFVGPAPFASADVHVTPDGRYLYASERMSNRLAAFRIDGNTGMPAPAGGFPTEEKPRGFNIDPAGRYLLAVGQASNHLTCYTIDADSGRLTARHRYPMGRNPHWVEIVEIGKPSAVGERRGAGAGTEGIAPGLPASFGHVALAAGRRPEAGLEERERRLREQMIRSGEHAACLGARPPLRQHLDRESRIHE